jgi:hypothetical protein
MPRLSFTLRVALILTAIVAVVLWQASIVQRRKAAMQGAQPVTFVLAVRQPGDSTAPPKLNPLRELIGDRPVSRIDVLAVAGCEATAERLARLFPEAQVEIVRAQPIGD